MYALKMLLFWLIIGLFVGVLFSAVEAGFRLEIPTISENTLWALYLGIVMLGLLFIYYIPSIFSFKKGFDPHKRMLIILTNVFFGWTILGWIIALWMYSVWTPKDTAA